MKKVLRIIALISGVISIVSATILGIIYLEQFLSRMRKYADKLEQRIADRKALQQAEEEEIF